MKITINKKACKSSEMCMNIAPSVFKMGEDGKATAYNLDSSLFEEAREAEDNCPVGAITVEEEN